MDAGIDAAKPKCRRNIPSDCASDEYCKVTNCANDASGTCTKKPSTATPVTFAPVCGCDDVSYWNDSIAAGYGANIKAGSGACPNQTARKCSAVLGCPGQAKCNYDQGAELGCNGINLQGICWGILKPCPEVNKGGSRPCTSTGGANDCKGFCDAIEDQKPFYTQGTNCPQ